MLDTVSAVSMLNGAASAHPPAILKIEINIMLYLFQYTHTHTMQSNLNQMYREYGFISVQAMLNERVRDKYGLLPFGFSCFKTLEEIDNKPLRDLASGSEICDEMVIVRDPIVRDDGTIGYDYYAVREYIHPSISYQSVIDKLMDHLTLLDNLPEKPHTKLLANIRECQRMNPHSLRMFELEWEYVEDH